MAQLITPFVQRSAFYLLHKIIILKMIARKDAIALGDTKKK